MRRPIYNRKDWVLGRCTKCNRLNYVEPHGTTAKCKCSAEWTEHTNIPYSERDASGCVYIGARHCSYIGHVEADLGCWLLGGVRSVSSSRFATREAAQRWVAGTRETNEQAGRTIAGTFIEKSDRKPEINE